MNSDSTETSMKHPIAHGPAHHGPAHHRGSASIKSQFTFHNHMCCDADCLLLFIYFLSAHAQENNKLNEDL